MLLPGVDGIFNAAATNNITITSSAIIITWEAIEVAAQKHGRGVAPSPLLLRPLAHPLLQVHHGQTSHCSLLGVHGFENEIREGTCVCRWS
jgi:hypothetical protein